LTIALEPVYTGGIYKSINISHLLQNEFFNNQKIMKAVFGNIDKILFKLLNKNKNENNKSNYWDNFYINLTQNNCFLSVFSW
jgi:fructose-1,6-bisphosphatase